MTVPTLKRERRVLTPPVLAKQLGCDPNKVLHWIRTGQLKAINIAKDTGGKPRYVITPEALRASWGAGR